MRQLKIPETDKPRYTKIWVKPSVWAQFGAICDEMGMTRGDVIEIVTTLMNRAEIMPVGRLVEEVLTGVLKRVK